MPRKPTNSNTSSWSKDIAYQFGNTIPVIHKIPKGVELHHFNGHQLRAGPRAGAFDGAGVAAVVEQTGQFAGGPRVEKLIVHDLTTDGDSFSFGEHSVLP